MIKKIVCMFVNAHTASRQEATIAKSCKNYRAQHLTYTGECTSGKLAQCSLRSLRGSEGLRNKFSADNLLHKGDMQTTW